MHTRACRMNQHLLPRTDPMPRQACLACAPSDPYCSCLRLPARFDNVPKLISCYKNVKRALSARPKLSPAAHQKHPSPIQRP
jgi:hypothetical protein